MTAASDPATHRRRLPGRRRWRDGAIAVVGTAAVAGALVTTGCGADREPATIVVASGESIADAVERAEPGDTVEISPGVFHEEVQIDVEDVIVRGRDRNRVVLDGQDELANGVTVTADGVTVENLTITGYHQNGVLFNGTAEHADEHGDRSPGGPGASIDGFRASYLTTYDNGGYGVYAFASRNGTIDHVYASGHPDSGIYVGQCQACHVVVRDSVTERNAVGILFTNTSGDLQIVRNRSDRNRLGISVNSDHAEQLGGSADVAVLGNEVVDNDDPQTPAIARGFFSGGIALAGARDSLVARNRVTDHEQGLGIVVTSLDDWQPEGNQVVDNVLAANALDLVAAPTTAVAAACFAGNAATSSQPDGLEALAPCDGADVVLPAGELPAGDVPDGVDYRRIPGPRPQEPMPAGQRGAPAAADPVAPDAIEVPR